MVEIGLSTLETESKPDSIALHLFLQQLVLETVTEPVEIDLIDQMGPVVPDPVGKDESGLQGLSESHLPSLLFPQTEVRLERSRSSSIRLADQIESVMQFLFFH